MTIARRLGIAYAWISLACLGLVAWLGYHEFVEEPAEYAARGLPNIHKNTEAELSTVCFLGLVPVLLGLGWWWVRRVLAPLQVLTETAEKLHSHNLRQLLPRSGNGDEVDKLTSVFNSMTARLDESFRRIHEFTLHASHELKTPLTVMRMQLETAAREGATLPPELGSLIDGQLAEVQRLTQIVDGLTLLTKADAGLVELARQPVRLDQLVTEAYEDALILATPHQVRVTLDHCDPVAVLGDRHRLRQLLLILIDNGLKYNRPQGSLALALRVGHGGVEMRITNTNASTGEVIAPQTLERVFERFVRGENARGQVEGCGLGLTIAQWIVQAHGGSIELIAEPGGKTTARFTMPILSNPLPPSSRNGDANGVQPQRGVI